MSESGVHRPHVAGIHGRSNDGAYSLVLAGGYEDDVVCIFSLFLTVQCFICINICKKVDNFEERI